MSHESVKQEALLLLKKNDLDYAKHLYTKLNQIEQRTINQKINFSKRTWRYLSLDEDDRKTKEDSLFIKEVIGKYKKTVRASNRFQMKICKVYCKTQSSVEVLDYMVEVLFITDPTYISYILRIVSFFCNCKKRLVSRSRLKR